ncbi:MAG: DNA translocase FtsK, partial [Odoribacter sp.]|nr:DNA translocase FtsK [Odoribacter sp.]
IILFFGFETPFHKVIHFFKTVGTKKKTEPKPIEDENYPVSEYPIIDPSDSPFYEGKSTDNLNENTEEFTNYKEENNDIPKELDITDTEYNKREKEEREEEEEEEEEEEDIELTINKDKHEEMLSKNLQPKDNYDPTLDLSTYQYPPLDLLKEHSSGNPKVTQEELEENKNKIVETLRNYKIEITKIKATIGPTVTLYEIVPAPGVKIARIKSLEDDIALSLAALGIRIIAPIPGAGTIGIEVPNQSPETVSMRSIIASKKFQESKYALPIALGRTISNETYTFDLAKMPHLLVAGATGQGKSVGLNAIITSLLYKKHPSQLKFVMVDPKKVELSIYSIIEKHFLAKLPDEDEAIITETTKVIHTLNSLCIEMDNRYDLLKEAQVRNIAEYNEKFVKRQLNPIKGHKFLPYIVVIVDEFADLIMTAGKEVEQPIARIAQLARAVGIHMIIATQRPSTNIITGVIKANFPARIAFKVASMIDSRTILDSPGANQLIGRGDMLISVSSEMTRVQCAFVDTPEVENITRFINQQQSYPFAMALPEYIPDAEGNSVSEADLGVKDPLFEEAARLMVNSQQGSTSSIQRRFSIGYNRAGRIIDQLEAAGVVGPYEGSKARQVLIPDEYSLERLLKDLDDKFLN